MITRALSLRTLGALAAFAAAAAPSTLRAAEPQPAEPPAEQASAATPAPPPPLPPAQAPASTHLAPYIAGGLAVVAAGVGTAFGVLALNAKSDFEAHPTPSGADSGNNYAAYCDASLGAAVLLGATSLVLFFVERDQQDPAASQQARSAKAPPLVSFTAAPMLSAHGAGASAVVRF